MGRTDYQTKKPFGRSGKGRIPGNLQQKIFRNIRYRSRFFHTESDKKTVEKGTDSAGKWQLCHLRSVFQEMDQADMIAVNAHYASGVTLLA